MKTEDEMRELLLNIVATWGFRHLSENYGILQHHVVHAIMGKRRVSAAMARALGYRMEGTAQGVRTYHELTTK